MPVSASRCKEMADLAREADDRLKAKQAGWEHVCVWEEGPPLPTQYHPHPVKPFLCDSCPYYCSKHGMAAHTHAARRPQAYMRMPGHTHVAYAPVAPPPPLAPAYTCTHAPT